MMAYDAFKFGLLIFCFKSSTTTNVIPHVCLFNQTMCPANEITCASKTQTVEDETIIWPSSSNTAVSNPPCLDESFQFIHRECVNGTWTPEPKCTYLQKDLNLCPDDLTFLPHYKICYTITKPSPFPPSCPYNNVLPFYEYAVALEDIVARPFWIPVTRNLTNGVFEWLEVSKFYGDPFGSPYVYSGRVLHKNCLVYNYTNFEAVDCTTQYPAVCAYSVLQNMSSSTYCKQAHVGLSCIPKYFGASSVCSCLVSSDVNDGVEIADLCDRLAEFEQPYQNFFPGTQTCWIGLQKNASGAFVWGGSKRELSYAYWSPRVDFGREYGAVKDWEGWVLEEDGALSCAVCETHVKETNSELQLEFSMSDRQLILNVSNPEQLVQISGRGYTIKCFSDTGTLYFKSQYPYFESYAYSYLQGFNIFRYNPTIEGPGYYWCEGFQYPFLKHVSSNVVFVSDSNSYGTEYALVLSISYNNTEIPDCIPVNVEMISELGQIYNSSGQIYNVRPMRLLGIDDTNHVFQYLLHITVNKYITGTANQEYENIYQIVTQATDNASHNVTLDHFASCAFCYKTTGVDGNNVTLHWPTTNAGESAVPEELCLLSGGTAARRMCVGDFIFGAHWDEFNETCLDTIGSRSGVTLNLTNLLNTETNPLVVFNTLRELSEHYEEFEPIDIHLLGLIFRQHQNAVVSLGCLTYVVSNIIETNRSVLYVAQDQLNATNNILYNYDLLVQNHEGGDEVLKLRQENLVLFVVPLEANVTGVVLFNSNNTLTSETLYQNSSIDDVIQEEDLIAAVVIPDELLNQISNSSTTTASKVVVTLFLSDSLFNSNEDANVTDISHIFGVLIPGFTEEFRAPLQLIFKSTDYNDYNKTCAYWAFQGDAPQSKWKPDTDYQVLRTHSEFVLCEFWHVTHFALLILNDLRFLSDLPEGVSDSLDLITTINCSLSIFGLACILLTSILFKNWRRNTGNRVLINFIFAISLQIALFFLSSHLTKSTTLCTIGGALLHYSVLSEFCWMLVIAILQFKRFVQVFGGPPKSVLLKACAVGWAIPAVPVVCLLCVSPGNYAKNLLGICYPSGFGFYLGILLPLGIILCANMIIYVVILSDVFFKRTDTSHCLNSELIFQWRLVVLLFFMLGLTWSFGILAYFYDSLMFVYLFCLTSTLQGFVLFLFFIVFNNSTRMLYVRCFKSICRMY